MSKQIQIESVEFSEALRTLKKSLAALSALESGLAAAAIAMKLVDCLDSIITSNLTQALDDIWSCVAAIQRVLYGSLAEHLHKESNVVISAAHALDRHDYKLAAEQYISANVEITKETGFGILFCVGEINEH